MWKTIKCAIQGRSHKKNDTPCQDYVEGISSECVTCIALADGAGSASHSEEGAKVAVKTIVNYLNKNIKYLIDIEKVVVLRLIKYKIITELKKAIKEIGCDFEDISSTLLFIAIYNDKFLYGHIGDGVIGCLRYDEERLHIVSEAERGEFANTTYFTTSDNWCKHFRINKGSCNNIKAFFLMSDGSADCLYNNKTKQFAPAINKFSKWLDNNDTETVNQALIENMTNKFVQNTNDDCSFIMIQRQ